MGRSKDGATARHDQFPASDEASDRNGCSGRSCRSCIAVLLADCIALGCCPCAVANLLALVLLKVPWVAGKRCLKLFKKRRAASMKKRVRDEGGGTQGGEMGKKRIEMGIVGIGLGKDGSEGSYFVLDDERIWTELYEVGHWGFGRVSFSE